MKKLFVALMLTGFLGTSAVTAVSAASHTKVAVKGEDDKTKKKECKKDGKCCHASGDKAEAKTCTKGKSSCHAGTASSTESKEVKKEEQK